MLPPSISQALDWAQHNSLLLIKRLGHLAHAGLHPGSLRQVVFVGGVQRSGTNMLMDVLERSLETAVLHERDPRAYEDFVMLTPATIHRLVDSSPARCVVLKALCELQDLATLLDGFAPAKALWSVRNYEDVVNSHVRAWPGCSRTMSRLAADRNSMKWRGRGMSDATHATISQLYHPEMDDFSAVALFWYLRNVLFFEQALDRDPRVMTLTYESLVQTPNHEFRRIFEFLGMHYSRRVVAGVHARSVRKHPPPPIEPEVRALCDGLMARFSEVIERQERR